MDIKKYYFSNNVLIETIKEAVEIVQSTLGPLGRNVVIKRGLNSKPIITKDGVTVLKDIKYKESEKNAAIEIIKEAAQKTADIAGDGTTTASILLRAILEKSEKFSKVSNGILIKKGITRAISDAKKHIKDITRELTEEDIKKVASISANSSEIGKIISDVISEVGTDAVITVEESNKPDTTYEVVDGMRIDNRGFLSPYFITNKSKYIAELKNSYILIYDGNLSSLEPIVPIMEQIKTQSSEASILVIANSVEGDALSGLIVNKVRGMFNSVAIKSPSFGSDRVERMEDIAVLTGGTVISSTKGIPIDSADMDHLGYAEKIAVTKDHTDIINGKGDMDAIEKRVEELKVKEEQTESSFEMEKINERISKLVSGVAVLKVGGESEVEMKEKRDRIEDAVYATKAAIEDGIVPGGAYSFIYAHSKIEKDMGNSTFDHVDEHFGYQIVMESLIEPFKILCKNSGIDNYEQILTNILNKDQIYNFMTSKYEDKYTGVVIDPVKVIDTILSKVGSIASAIVTTEKMIIVDEDQIKEDTMPM